MKIRNFTFLLALLFSFNCIFAQNTVYVSLSGSNSSPYSSLATAATTIQTAVNFAATGDLILVDDGTYVLTTNISITKGITLRSINGKSMVTIDGNHVTRCLYINHADAVVDGFSIVNGYNPSGFGGGANIVSGGTIQNCGIGGNQARDGGGVAIDNSGMVLNCVISGNLASDNGSSGYGGGVRMLNGGITRNCLIHSNTSLNYGGGINIWNSGTIQSCTLTNNTAPNGAGVRLRNASSYPPSTMENTISYYNTGSNWQTSGTAFSFSNNCTTPALPSGTGNITTNPFTGTDYTLNPFDLPSGSPAIDAGLNQAWMTGAVDLDDNNRIIGGAVDIGAYEFNLPPLSPPVLVSPGGPLSNPGTPTSFPLNLTLRWNHVTGAFIYKVQLTLASDTDFNSPIIDTWAGYGDTSYSVTNLQYYTNYIWRVYAHNATTLQSSDWSETFVFATLLAPPVLISPVNNAAGVSINPTLTWYRSNGAHFHSYEIYSDQGCTNLVTSGSTPWAPLDTVVTITTNLANNTSYYWRVKPAAVLFTGDYSEVRKFTTVSAAVPLLSWPVGGVKLYTSPPTLTWYVPTGGAGLKYDLLYSTDINMVSPSIISDITNGSYTLNGLTNGTTYYWMVRSKTSSGAISAYSVKESFITAGGAVTVIPSWPVGGAVVYNYFPTLYWYTNGSSVGLTYEVEFVQGESGSLTGTPNVLNITTQSTTLNNLLPGTQYSWQVRSKDGSAYSEWSTPVSFSTIAGVTAVVPVPSWPIGAATVYTNSPTLYWYLNGSGTGLTYEVEYRVGALTGIPNINGITSMFTNLSGLTSGATYNWQIRSTDGTNTSAWSIQESFTVAGGVAGPIIPTPSWPIGGATIYSNSTILYWYIGTYRPDLTYDVEYTKGALTGTPTVTGITSLNYTLTGLSNDEVYNWQVRSYDGATYSAWSVQESFSTIAGSGGPGVPTPSWPIGGATVYTNSPILYWYVNTGSYGLTYELEYSTDPGLANAVTVTGIATTNISLTGLTSGASYYWRVRSFNGSMYSAYSSIESFASDAANASVVPIPGSPAGGVLIETASPTFSWILPTAGSGLTYELQYSTSPDMSGASNLVVESTSENIDGLDQDKTYYWRIRSKTVEGETSSFSKIENFKTPFITSSGDNEIIPTNYELMQNYPNPFNPTTNLRFSLPEAGYYRISVFNIIGQKVAILVDGELSAGTHNVVFDASGLVSGLYFYQLSGNNVNITKKMMLIR